MPTTVWTVRDLAERHHLTLLPGSSPRAGAEVSGVCLDSRRVGPGMLYAALPGGSTHGARFVAQAAVGGAVAVLTDPAGAELAERGLAAEPGQEPPVLLVCDRPREQLGPLAADLHGRPSDRLALVGVTGTNGKTTVSVLVDELLRSTGVTTGLIGTIRSRVADEELASSFTTPEAPDLHALLARMVEAGCRAATTEVSSHALAQHRVDGTRFALVVFTNLSRDHLDFHGTIEAYFEAKARLFTGGFAPAAVVAVDDAWGVRVADLAREAGLHVVTVGGAGTGADVTVAVTDVEPSGAQVVRLTGLAGSPVRLHLGMPGAFNATNAALALTVVQLLQSPPSRDGAPVLPAVTGDRPRSAQQLAELFAGLPGVPGRMERVTPPGPEGRDGPAGLPLVVVDYAHTPDAVAGAVTALRAATPGRLVVVLGAGGDRDQGKRRDMGRAAAGADLVVVTDDNPRTEDPAAIRAAVLAGVEGTGTVEVGDRARAVEVALAACQGPDDTVLLAGKGHETGQSVGGTTHPFDDRVVAREALQAWAVSHGRAER